MFNEMRPGALWPETQTCPRRFILVTLVAYCAPHQSSVCTRRGALRHFPAVLKCRSRRELSDSNDVRLDWWPLHYMTVVAGGSLEPAQGCLGQLKSWAKLAHREACRIGLPAPRELGECPECRSQTPLRLLKHSSQIVQRHFVVEGLEQQLRGSLAGSGTIT